MQVVIHLRTVEPSDSYYGDSIADDGREGKRSVQCSVFSVQMETLARGRRGKSWGQGKRVCGYVGVGGKEKS